MARRMNLVITISDLNMEQLDADEEYAVKLGVVQGTCLTRVRRVIRADTRPVAYLIDALPENVLRLQDLPQDFNGSVLDFLLERGDRLQLSRAAISATNATAEVAKALEIQRGDVLLRFVSQLYTAEGKMVDYSTSYFIPGYFNFHVNRRVGSV
jgi:GntR family transcriptional regulator